MSENIISESEWYDLVLKFEEREESAIKFCNRYNISIYRIYKWRRYFLDKQNQDLVNKHLVSKDFIPITVTKAGSRIDSEHHSESSKISENLHTKKASGQISSSFKVSKSDISIEFVKGCSLCELGALLEVMNATK